MNLIKISVYVTDTGKSPYFEWENKLESFTKAIVSNRIDRIKVGNFGDAKMIKDGSGIWELRIDYGPGYRIYFGKQGLTVVILLTGGDKKSQKRDIKKAQQCWLEYKGSL